MQKIIAWIKENPTFGFIGGLALLVALVLLFANPTPKQTPVKTAKQEKQQEQLLVKKKHKGVTIFTNNIAYAVPLGDEPINTISGKAVSDGFKIIAINADKISPSKAESTVVMPIPENMSKVSFTISQEMPDDPNLTKFAYATILDVLVDGEVAQTAEITKQNLLARDIKVTADNANQIVIKLKTKGYREEKNSSEKDQYGPWFTLIISDFQKEAK